MNPTHHKIPFPMIYTVCWGQFHPSKIIGGGRGVPCTTSISYSAKVCTETVVPQDYSRVEKCCQTFLQIGPSIDLMAAQV